MAKEVVYFNAIKKIDTITINYNEKLDGAFVNEVATSIKDIAKKMGSKVNLKDPKDYYEINVFIYPSKDLFNKIFSGEIKRKLTSKLNPYNISLEDMYVVQDSDGNIHIVSPRGMGKDKKEAFKRIIVMRVLGEYMNEKEKQKMKTLLKESMRIKEEKEVEEKENQEEELDEQEPDEETEEIEEEEIEQNEEELSEEELDDIIATELALEEIDERQDEKDEEIEEKKQMTKSDTQEWLDIGWLALVQGRLKKQKDIEKFAKHISKNGVSKLTNLTDSKFFDSYNYAKENACALVEFIIETYGMKKLVQFYENPKDYKGTFGVSKFVFNNMAKAYIYNKYKLNIEESVEETDKQKILQKDEVDEITNKFVGEENDKKEFVKQVDEIHFERSGGVEITERAYIDLKQKEEKEIEDFTGNF